MIFLHVFITYQEMAPAVNGRGAAGNAGNTTGNTSVTLLLIPHAKSYTFAESFFILKDMKKIAENMGEVPVRSKEFADISRRNER